MQILIVSAVKFEALPTLKALKRLGFRASYAAIGIGPLAAAKSAASVTKKAKGKHVIFLGSAGTNGAFSKPTLIRARQTVWSPLSVRMKWAYAIAGIYPEIALPRPPAWAKKLPGAKIACTSTITRRRLPPSADRYLESLELYSCAAELVSAGKSFVAIFGITNALGPNAHSQWLENHKTVAQMTADYIAAHLPIR